MVILRTYTGEGTGVRMTLLERMAKSDEMRERESLSSAHAMHGCEAPFCYICANTLAFCMTCRCVGTTLLHDCPGHPVSMEAQGDWNVVSLADHSYIMLYRIARAAGISL